MDANTVPSSAGARRPVAEPAPRYAGPHKWQVASWARLIRRAKRRGRPLWWHTQRRMLQALGLFAGLYLLGARLGVTMDVRALLERWS